MPFFYRLSILICFFLIRFPVFSQQNEALLKEKKTDSLFAAWTSNTPGLSVGVVRNGKIIFQKAYGLANLEYDMPVTPATPFHAASLSKQFTAFCILLLQQKGLVSLEDDIRKYIPELPDYRKTITLRHLATHTSGLRDQWRLLEMAGWRLDDVIRKEQVLSLVYRQHGLNFAPGEKFMYCNTGYTLLAEVVERVSGTSFAKYAQENIFKKLGMDQSFFYDDYEKTVKQRAYSYHKDGKEYKKSVLNYSIAGPTSLFTTAADLCKWAIFLNAPDEPFRNIVTLLNTQAKLNDSSVLETALGQFTGVKFHGLEWFDHTGSDAGFRSYLGRFPEHNAAVTVLSNSVPVNASGLAISLADIFLKDHYQDKPPAPKKPLFEHDPAKFIKLTKEQLSVFCGKYWQPDDWYNREIQIVNDTLVYVRPGGAVSRLLPVSANELKMLGDREDVSISLIKDKENITQLQMTINNGKPLTFIKYQAIDPDLLTGDFYSEELGSVFSVFTRSNKLYLSNIRLGEFELQPINPDLLISDNRNFRKITVLRDKKKKVTGILVDNAGITGFLFSKR